ncbi:hypothetical protein Taro_048222 [Colocasia esculenta]|uniref:NAD-dependent epimerase/dehydratase domain-containing protein n=1 Tax=Colocasia esculenta TaxID=4460 RepID=A0A843WXK6_COLES|nr:hypothetical protein [Colocasia esculenta]
MDVVESRASAVATGPRAAAETVCVTGSTGYIGSWLVRSLLRRGYAVHAAARDLGKASKLVTSWVGSGEVAGARRRHLKLFKADMDEEGSHDEAVKGCVGVFHVAASMEFNVPPGPTDLGKSHVRSNMLDPAIRGTINILRSCQKARTVRRVVFTSSISTITARDISGDYWKPVVDESSLVSVDTIWKKKPDGWVYVLSKVLSEEAAFRYAKENGIDLVSVIPPTVAGPFFTPKVPASVRVLLSPITNDPELYSILLAVHSRLGSISLVHIEDICDAHIFLMEEKAAEGRYICSAGSCVMPRLADLLSSEYALFTNTRRFKDEFQDSFRPVISSNRLLDLGFGFKYGERDIVKQSVDCCLDCGFLKDPS